MWVSQSVSKSNGLEEILTDVSRCDGCNDFGSRGLERGVHGSNNGGRGRCPGRRLVLCGRHNAGDRLGRSLCDRGVDGRASGRCPRSGVGAILRRPVLHRCITSRSGRRDKAGGGGEDRQHVESELHLDVN